MPKVSAWSTSIVFALGMSMPDSMIVVDSSTSYSPRSKSRIFFASVRASICPCATTIRALGHNALRRRSAFPMENTRLWRK